MKNFFFILLFLFLFQAVTNAQSNNVWKKQCIKNKENKDVCYISTKLTLTNNKKEVIGNLITISVRYIDHIEKNLSLVDEKNKTYELKEKKIKKPFMIINAPMGVDLRSGLIVSIGKNFNGKADFVRCTQQGCETNMLVSPQIRKAMEVSESMKLQFIVYGKQNPNVVELSLMGFKKKFSKLK